MNDCDRTAQTRGWCDRHYRIWRRNGDPTIIKPYYNAPRDLETVRRRNEKIGAASSARWQAIRDARTPDDVAARIAARRQMSRDRQRQYRERHADEVRSRRRKQMASYGPEYRHKWNHYNRLRRAGIDTPDAEAAAYSLILRGDGCCYCGAPMEHIDHIDPIALGGSGDWDNLTAACASCNSKKSAQSLLMFLLRQRATKGGDVNVQFSLA